MKLRAAGCAVVPTVLFAIFIRSFGRPMFVFLMLVMFLLATTELGTDGWIQDIMGSVLKRPDSRARCSWSTRRRSCSCCDSSPGRSCIASRRWGCWPAARRWRRLACSGSAMRERA